LLSQVIEYNGAGFATNTMFIERDLPEWEAVMRGFFLGLLSLILFTACSNDSILQGISQSSDSSHDAIIEDARMALDDSDYEQVISDLSVMYNTTTPGGIDPEVARLLASGYMGKAWVDVTYFVGSAASDPFDIMASAIFSSKITSIDNDSDGIVELYIDGTLMPGLITDISTAKRILEVLRRENLATDDDAIQLGIASAVHFIMYVGDKTADALNSTLHLPNEENHQPGIVPVPISTNAFKYYKSSNSYKNLWNTYIINDSSGFRDTTAGGSTPSYQEDLININHAVIAFSRAYPGSNEMKDKLNTFLYSALNENTGTTITDALIMTYATDGISTYVQGLAN
jgi:hypothetical protein